MNEQKTINYILILILVFVIGGLYMAFSKPNNIENDTALSTEEVAEKEESEVQDEIVEVKKEVVRDTYVPRVEVPAPLPKVDPVVLDPQAVVVTYTESGFIPPVVEITAGGSVTFINASSKPLWVTSENHPTAKAQIYRGFDQGKSMSQGGTYIFSFTQVGVWGYKNLNQESHLGAISVIAQ